MLMLFYTELQCTPPAGLLHTYENFPRWRTHLEGQWLVTRGQIFNFTGFDNLLSKVPEATLSLPAVLEGPVSLSSYQ